MVVATARDAADLLAPLFADLDGERIAVLHLDGARRVIDLDAFPVAQVDGSRCRWPRSSRRR